MNKTWTKILYIIIFIEATMSSYILKKSNGINYKKSLYDPFLGVIKKKQTMT